MAERRGGGFWLALSGVALLAYVVAEVAALIWVTKEIGWWTLLILVVSSLLGVFLLQREWRKAWGSVAESLRAGQLPSGQLADTTLILGGGVLLILPGLLSDIVGVLLLLPFTRPFIRSAISWWAARTLQKDGASVTVIEGETVDAPDTPIPAIEDDTVVEGVILDPEDDRQ